MAPRLFPMDVESRRPPRHGDACPIPEIQSLLDSYRRWLRDRTSLRETGDWMEITTPYLDRHNDCLRIYARRENGGFVLTDDGYILDDLALSGRKVESPRRLALLKTAAAGFGVTVDGKALRIRANSDNFGQKKHDLVQAMLALDDLFYLAAPAVANLLHEDVAAWLDLSDIRWTPNARFPGRSGLTHRFELVIPKSRAAPERLLRAFNRPSRNAAQTMAFAWLDVRDARPPESRAYAVLNDSDRPVADAVLDAMRNYRVKPLPWSNRDAAREDLAA